MLCYVSVVVHKIRYRDVHIGVRDRRLVDVRVANNKQDLCIVSIALDLGALVIGAIVLHTPFGLLRVTRVMPGMCLRPSLPIAFRAFFSFRLWTAT